MIDYFWLIPMPVLFTMILTLLFGKKLGLKSAYLGMLGTIASFCMSLSVLPDVIAGTVKQVEFTWFLNFKFGFMLDPLTITLLLLVSFLATFILLYANGYMHGEGGLMRFFAEVQLFTFSMLGVVIADNILQAFIFWEIMGLCSYLLIGFWFHKPSAAAAAKKAFLTTRVGDVFMLIGILILYTQTGSLQYHEIFAAAANMDPFWITAATLGLFGGVIGKSAQFPLHVWLPDAMEGPTPVSALIHAATMVKAGIYLMARFMPLLVLAPISQNFMVIIGLITALGTALMALTATDFKRVLAFSTLSQLGFMVVALGTLNMAGAILHLINHAFFKALLFLGAGCVIHVTGTNNIWEMGGVWKKDKVTAITVLIATISIAGIPPLSGFWSKDEILIGAAHANPIFCGILLLASFLTAFYMFRLYYVVFAGKPRTEKHGHACGKTMLIPLVVLSFFAAFSGLFSKPIARFITGETMAHGSNTVMMISIVVALLGFLLATVIYGWQKISAAKIANTFKGICTLLINRYYIDAAYNWFCNHIVVGLAKVADFFDKHVIDGIIHIVRDVTLLVSKTAKWVDIYIVDGIIRGICSGFVFGGSEIRKTSTGQLQQYLLLIAAAVTVMIALVWGGLL